MPAALIKTLEDWNNRMCGCCEMPECPTPPSLVGKHVTVTQTHCGFGFINAENTERYMFQDYAEDETWSHNIPGEQLYTGTYQRRLSKRFVLATGCTYTVDTTSGTPSPGCSYNYGSDYVFNRVETETLNEGASTYFYSLSESEAESSHSYSTVKTRVYSSPIPRDGSSLVAEAKTVIPARFAGGYTNDWFNSARFQKTSSLNFVTSVFMMSTRYRWQIHSDHAGSYFKIIYDIIEEPDGWDIAPPVPPVEPDTVSDPGAEPVELITNPAHVVWENAAEAWANAWDPPADAPPYPSAPSYDAKVWPCYRDWRKSNPNRNVLIWNVGA